MDVAAAQVQVWKLVSISVTWWCYVWWAYFYWKLDFKYRIMKLLIVYYIWAWNFFKASRQSRHSQKPTSCRPLTSLKCYLQCRTLGFSVTLRCKSIRARILGVGDGCSHIRARACISWDESNIKGPCNAWLDSLLQAFLSLLLQLVA